MTVQDAIEAIRAEADQAGRTFQANRKNNEPETSIAYDEGRRRGLLDALEIVPELNGNGDPSGA
jgi:hypothetical protein